MKIFPTRIDSCTSQEFPKILFKEERQNLRVTFTSLKISKTKVTLEMTLPSRFCQKMMYCANLIIPETALTNLPRVWVSEKFFEVEIIQTNLQTVSKMQRMRGGPRCRDRA